MQRWSCLSCVGVYLSPIKHIESSRDVDIELLVCSKVSRSFAGHRSGVISVEFHPMKNDFIASGSSDTNVRVWDLRRKICHQTFKGHAKGACCLAFSPDGKWIASGSEDGEVKVRNH